MDTRVRHLVLTVPGLRAAERFYASVFAMTLIGREAVLAGGLWYSLPLDKGWEDAAAAGIELTIRSVILRASASTSGWASCARRLSQTSTATLNGGGSERMKVEG